MLDRLFFPRAVAVVGASPNLATGRAPYFQILRNAGYKGRLYPVNPSHEEIEGEPVYPSLDAVPEGVDLAICVIPVRVAVETLQAAVRKGIPFVHFFTSGFSEMGNTELEQAMVRIARQGGTRIVGPNCLGVHCAESRVTFDPTIKQEELGTVAFLGQSGGVTNNFMRMAAARRIWINKAVSYGNQIDLAVEDYLEYLSGDEQIRAIAAYIEDVKDGRRFLEVLGKTTASKPVIILKGGVTREGAEAARSHTGAMAGRYPLWSAMMRQCRCIEAHTERHMVDVLMMMVSEKIPSGDRVGFLGAGGGTSVLFTDLAVKAGLSLPELGPDTQRRISEAIPAVNTSTRNPVDLGASGFDYRILTRTMSAMDRDPVLDMLIIYLSLDFLNLFERKHLEEGLRAVAAAGRELSKPLIPVLVRSADDKPGLEEIRLMALGIFREAGMSMYNDLPDAVLAVSSALAWSRRAPDPRGRPGRVAPAA